MHQHLPYEIDRNIMFFYANIIGKAFDIYYERFFIVSGGISVVLQLRHYDIFIENTNRFIKYNKHTAYGSK